MNYAINVMAPTLFLTLGLTGILHAAGGQSQSGGSQPGEGSQMQQQSSGSSQQQGQMETVKGTVQKVEGNIYTIKSEQGKEMRLHIEQNALQGKEPQEGDKIQAKVMKGGEEFNVISAQKSGQGASMQSPSSSGKQKKGQGQATETITGEITKVEGNVYYVQDSSGKEIRLRLDQSAQQSGDLKEGDTIEALVTKEKEYHVISAEPAQ